MSASIGRYGRKVFLPDTGVNIAEHFDLARPIRISGVTRDGIPDANPRGIFVGRLAGIFCPDICSYQPQVFSRNDAGRLYQRRFNDRIEFLGHNQFLIESLDTSIMEAAGMAGNGRSRLPGGAA